MEAKLLDEDSAQYAQDSSTDGDTLGARRRRDTWITSRNLQLLSVAVGTVIVLGLVIAYTRRGGHSSGSDGSSSGSNAGTTTTTTTTTTTLLPIVTPPCFSELKAFSILESDPDYARLRVVNNPYFNNRMPSFIALPRTTHEVQLALKCAAREGIQVALKSGGHNLAGFSSIDRTGFQMNFARMKAVSMNALAPVPYMTFQSGARWLDTYSALRNDSHGSWLIVGGLCPSVGAMGFMLGGGVSPSARAHGLGSDNVLSITMVTANGSDVVVANETSHPDLFWALRGAGNSQYGVVTDMTIKIHSATSNAYTWGTVCYYTNNITQISLALNKFAQISPGVAHTAGIDVRLRLQDGLCLWMIMRDDFDAAYSVLKPMIDVGADSFRLTAYPTYYDMIMAFATARDYREVNGRPFEARNCLIPELTPAASEAFTTVFFDPSNPGCDFFLIQFEGAINTLPRNASAFFWRDSHFMAMAACSFDDEVHHERVIKYLDKFYNTMYPHCEGSYVNFFDVHLKNWQREYYGGNLERLLHIKQVWNPTGSSPIRFLRELGTE